MNVKEIEGRLAGLSTIGQSFLINGMFDFCESRGGDFGQKVMWYGRLKEKDLLPILTQLINNNQALYLRLNDAAREWLGTKEIEPDDIASIIPVSIDQVKDDPRFKEIESLLPLRMENMSDYLVFLEELAKDAYEDISNVNTFRMLLMEIEAVKEYLSEGKYNLIMREWEGIENRIITLKNDFDIRRRAAVLESKKMFLTEYFIHELNKVWAHFFIQRSLTVYPLTLGTVVGRLRVITDVEKDTATLQQLKGDEIVMAADFPPTISPRNPPVGIINTLPTGITSHASVRAKAWNIPCAGLYNVSLDMLSHLNGQWVVLDAALPTGVLRLATEEEIANRSKLTVVPEVIIIPKADISDKAPDIVNGYAKGIENFVGPKAVNQLFLQQRDIGAKVPRSIALTYKLFTKILNLQENEEYRNKINALFSAIDKTDYREIRETLESIQNQIFYLKVPEEITNEIILNIKKYIPNAHALMVRAATNADDLTNHPGVGAGMYGTFFCKKIYPDDISFAIRSAYASLFSYDAFIERELYDIPHSEVSPSILIQEFIPADYSFGIHTVHPVSGNKNLIFIEAMQGLGPGLREQYVGLPHQFVLNKQNNDIISSVKSTKQVKVTAISEDSHPHSSEGIDYNKDIFLRTEGRGLVQRMVKIGIKIEQLYGQAQDIEGAIVMTDGQPEIYILQSRAQKIALAYPRADSTGDNVGTSSPVVSKTLLYVEDDDFKRLTTTRALKRAGFNVIEASNGKVALDIVEKGDSHIDLIITDVRMPEMDGARLVNALGYIKKSGGVIPPIIIYAGFPAEAKILQEHLNSLDIKRLPKTSNAELVAFINERFKEVDGAANPAASPLQKNRDDLGGIDMRHLAKNTVIENRDSPLPPLIRRRASRGQSLFSESPVVTDPNELQEIQRLIQAGIIPSVKRLEECRGSCSAESLLSCIADILRIEEERATATGKDLKNFLVMLESR